MNTKVNLNAEAYRSNNMIPFWEVVVGDHYNVAVNFFRCNNNKDTNSDTNFLKFNNEY